jgi:pimeloyl-ACP methyl ester carboxylesterase
MTEQIAKELESRSVCQLASELAQDRLEAARRRRASTDAVGRRRSLREGWARLLGDVEPLGNPEVLTARMQTTRGLTIERIDLRVQNGITVPLVLLRSALKRHELASPVVLATSRSGKQLLVRARAAELAELIQAGVVVCLPDLRGTGETSPGDSLGFRSLATTLSCRDQVLGQTLLGSRLRDLRSVLRYLRGRDDLGGSFALWGDSIAEVNPDSRSEVVPLGVSNPNVVAHPTGGLLVLLGALFEEDVGAVVARGTLASFRSLLDSQFLYVPHDAVVPGALAFADVSDIVGALAPRAVRIENTITGLNRAVSSAALQDALSEAVVAYRRLGARDNLSLDGRPAQRSTVQWLVSALLKRGPGRQ